MRVWTMTTGAAAVLAAFLSAGTAMASGDAAKGEQIAKDVCGTCHQLPDGSGMAVGPAMADVAADETIDTAKMQEILDTEPHKSAAPVNEGDAAHLAAYLQSLK